MPSSSVSSSGVLVRKVRGPIVSVLSLLLSLFFWYLGFRRYCYKTSSPFYLYRSVNTAVWRSSSSTEDWKDTIMLLYSDVLAIQYCSLGLLRFWIASSVSTLEDLYVGMALVLMANAGFLMALAVNKWQTLNEDLVPNDLLISFFTVVWIDAWTAKRTRDALQQQQQQQKPTPPTTSSSSNNSTVTYWYYQRFSYMIAFAWIVFGTVGMGGYLFAFLEEDKHVNKKDVGIQMTSVVMGMAGWILGVIRGVAVTASEAAARQQRQRLVFQTSVLSVAILATTSSNCPMPIVVAAILTSLLDGWILLLHNKEQKQDEPRPLQKQEKEKQEAETKPKQE